MILKYRQEGKSSITSLILIAISCLCVLLQLYALPHNNTFLVSFSGRLLLISWVLFAGAKIIGRLAKPVSRQIISVLLVIVVSFLVFLISVIDANDFSVDNFVQMLGFLSLPLMILYSFLFEIDDKAKNIVAVFFVLVSFILISLYFSDYRYRIQNEYGVYTARVVTLGYNNPNRTAMYLLVCCFGLITSTFFCKQIPVKILLIIDAVFISWIMLKTESRVTFLMLPLFLFLVLVARIKMLNKIWVWAVLAAPLVFMLLPLIFEQTIDLMFRDESLFNGRDQIFFRYYESFDLRIALLGDLNTFCFENLHNGYLAIAASMGIPTCVLYLVGLKNLLIHNLQIRDIPFYAKIAIISVLCLIVQTCAEAAFFVGGVDFAFLFFSLCIFFVKPYK